MITRVKFENFKALRDVGITFDSRLTVIVGPNGSGKTSVLRAIELLGKVAGGQAPEPALGVEFAPDLTYSGDSEGPQVLEANCSLVTGSSLTARIVVQGNSESGRRQWKFVSEGLLLNGGPPTVVHKLKTAPPTGLRTATFLQLNPKRIAEPSVIQLPQTTAPDGGGTASTLAFLHRTELTRFNQVKQAVTRVIPNVTDLRVSYAAGADKVRDSYEFDFKGAPRVHAGGASAGTLFVVGLFSVLFGPTSPSVVLLDDVDYALHPKGQMELVEMLHAILDQFPDLQIIATSHSPYILDKLKPNEVRVMALKDDGSAVCAKLEDHPKYPMWKDSMLPGEFWSHAGEEWVKDLVPQTTAP